MQKIRQSVEKEFADVNQLIIEQLHSDVPLVENIGHYIVDAGGKRLRPMLALLMAGALSEDQTQISRDHITFAAVIEFIHTATLLHDDVVDISSLRRGRPTANAEWGNASSVLVGDFLYTRAFQLLVAIGNMSVMQLMANTTNTIAEGEVLQLTKAGDPNTTEAEYFEVIKNKTAVLFAAATAGSALLSGKNTETIDQCYQYGLHLGTAFQLIDDVLDYTGNPETMGKNVGDDLAEGKPTLPLIYAMKNGTSQEAELIRQAIQHKSQDKLEHIITIVQNTNALDESRQVAVRHTHLALKTLDKIPDNPYKGSLGELTQLAVSREN